MTKTGSDRSHTALDLVAAAAAEVRATDPADTPAALLSAWHGFTAAGTAGGMLAADNPEDGVLARNARPVLVAVAERLQAAPSLPYSDPAAEPVTGLVPDDVHDSESDDQLPPATTVRAAILDLVLALNSLLSTAAGHARDAADRRACQEGTRLAHELGSCWEGRLRSFLNS